MPIASLYTICLERIYLFLKEGMWKSCIPNPFSELPTQLVDDLMELTVSHGEDPPKVNDVILLLTSGRLRRLDLSPFKLKAEQDLTVKEMGTICLRNPALNSEDLILHFVRNIISCSTRLEEFYSEVHPGFEVFLKCPNLRILKIYKSYSEFLDSKAPIDLSVLSTLKNLEVIHVFYMDNNTIANVLESCPKLISIGVSDSLDSLEEIVRRRQKNFLLNFDVPRYFQLRRCVWGKDFRNETHNNWREYNSSFGGKIRSAVELCPLVQELVIHVHQKDGYEELKFLKHLNLLSIDFQHCHGDILPGFVAFLGEMESQLKHLSIIWKNDSIRNYYPIPVDVICDCKSQLESLEIWGSICIRDSSKSSRDLALRRLTLYVENEDHEEEAEESLLFLLSNCKHLEELFLLCFPPTIDDTRLNQIFEMNTFSQLKVSLMEDSIITRAGFEMLLEKLTSIETVLIITDFEQHFYDANILKDPNLHYPENVYGYVSLKEFFCSRLDKRCF